MDEIFESFFLLVLSHFFSLRNYRLSLPSANFLSPTISGLFSNLNQVIAVLT